MVKGETREKKILTSFTIILTSSCYNLDILSIVLHHKHNFIHALKF